MPSKKKKKVKGKARGAAKSRKELSNDSAANEVKQDEDALLEEAINLAAAEREQLEAAAENGEENNEERCSHGFSPLPRGHVCTRFIQSFVREFSARDGHSTFDIFMEAHDATFTKYEAVWRNPDLLEYVATYYLAEGTDMLLEGKDVVGKDNPARQSAALAMFFEQWGKSVLSANIPDTRSYVKMGELSSDTCDEHTLVSFFRKRITCKCLDKKYKEVKSIVKMGHCDNPGCILPDRKTERSKLMYCERCRMVYYCSVDCQRAHWPSHKYHCIETSKLI